MGVISAWVDTAQGQLDGVAASTFGDLVEAAGNTISAMATLAIVLLGINMVMQFRPMSAGYVLATVIKLVVIVWIGLRWDQFNQITSAIISGMDSFAAVLLGSEDINTSLADSIDLTISKVSDAANAALEPLGYMYGALMSGIITVLITIIGGIVALALIFVSVVLTLYLGIAPIFIALSMFEATRDFFSRWLQGLATYILFPVVMAGVLGVMVRIVEAYLETLSTADASESIGGFIPFLTTLMIMIFIIILIPSIVSGLTGMMQFSGPLSPVTRTVALARAATTEAKKVGNAFSGGPKKDGSGGTGTDAPSGGGAARSTAANISQKNAKYP